LIYFFFSLQIPN